MGQLLYWNSVHILTDLPLNKNGVIIIIEDDSDDQYIMEEAFKQLDNPNQRIYFPDSQAALTYLNGQSSPTFLIISDVKLPLLTGLELRKELRKNADTSLMCVPYLYFTTALNHRHVVDAYCESAQGFFVKPTSFSKLTSLLELIIRYWNTSAAPDECFNYSPG